MISSRLKVRKLYRIVFLVFLSLLCEHSLSAQTRVQITVNGPWVYAEDPSDATRVVLIATHSDHHGPATLVSGDYANANEVAGPIRLVPGKLILNFASPCEPSSGSPRAFPVAVSADVLKKIIDEKHVIDSQTHKEFMRYRISLPKPCSYVSRHSSRSRLEPESNNRPVKEEDYTTSMELHYRASGDLSAGLTGQSDDGMVSYNDKLQFVSKGSGAPTITIGIYALQEDSDLECDSHSLESFVQLNDLFGWKLQVQFPKLENISGGSRQTRDYSNDPACVGRSSTHLVYPVQLSQQTLIKIDQVDAYLANSSKLKGFDAKGALAEIRRSLDQLFRNNVPGTIQEELDCADKNFDGQRKKPCGLRMTRDSVAIKTFGSGDCNLGQFSVNGVVR